jgi:hypothetical protein
MVLAKIGETDFDFGGGVDCAELDCAELGILIPLIVILDMAQLVNYSNRYPRRDIHIEFWHNCPCISNSYQELLLSMCI